MSKENIFITKPFLPPLNEYSKYLEEIWNNKQLTNSGPFHQKFEKALSNYLGVKYVSLVNNATTGLIIAQKALGFKGEIITTPFSFIATTHSIEWNGLKPIFVDTDNTFGNLDLSKVEEAINENTGGILALHNFGIPSNIGKLQRIADRYSLPLLYDAAPAISVKYKGNSIFQYGDCSVVSFHATKVFTTFEGGAVISRSRSIKEKIDQMRNFSIINEEQIVGLGINGKMNEAEAALGLLQLKYLQSIIEKRKSVFEFYFQEIQTIPGIEMNEIPTDVKYNYSYVPVFFNGGIQVRDQVYAKMKQNKIWCRKYWYPIINKQSPYNHKIEFDLPNAEELSKSILCLPIYPDLTREELNKIISVLRFL